MQPYPATPKETSGWSHVQLDDTSAELNAVVLELLQALSRWPPNERRKTYDS